ncbi:ABC transporter permease [Pusillimonas noertemannii]|uniref:Monosaccharide ABC transporter membrane protein (CUT2 family) n=1 Tax=Pusillimonas noertemannii TaxID=305977 RepID=A0A2U1CR00_9BURK|nr:ABC transporter permease [Pusillimonas noertemannii]NYT67646.1 ABC transporter permease [Pusillimonas noertemannii]PVY68318.1 monosaccharide ABC transporter membrane protein (CUT2 family) [Pusillimonas noertemannii]TFL12193.1 ABC transporter permease [Pusillimonas noertemannii]
MNAFTFARPESASWARTRASISMHTLVVGCAMVALLIVAVLTPGFISLPNLIALTGTLSLIGCVAIGMTFITLGGNIMSFCLGATCAAASMLVAHLSGGGGWLAGLAGIALALAVMVAQGMVIGLFRANPLIVSIASLSLILGVAQYLAGGQTVYVSGDSLSMFKARFLGVPAPLLVFAAAVIAGEFVLRFTRFGYKLILVGSNPEAAEVGGISTWRTTVAAYAAAGLFTGVAGILLAARYGSGSMEFGVGFDYSAISAVLVGGTAIGGGQGSVLRTMFGVVFIAVMQSLLLLYGLDVQFQYLLIGLVVLAAILLQSRSKS